MRKTILSRRTFDERFSVIEWRNAVTILSSVAYEPWRDIINHLTRSSRASLKNGPALWDEIGIRTEITVAECELSSRAASAYIQSRVVYDHQAILDRWDAHRIWLFDSLHHIKKIDVAVIHGCRTTPAMVEMFAPICPIAILLPRS